MFAFRIVSYQQSSCWVFMIATHLVKQINKGIPKKFHCLREFDMFYLIFSYGVASLVSSEPAAVNLTNRGEDLFNL